MMKFTENSNVFSVYLPNWMWNKLRAVAIYVACVFKNSRHWNQFQKYGREETVDKSPFYANSRLRTGKQRFSSIKFLCIMNKVCFWKWFDAFFLFIPCHFERMNGSISSAPSALSSFAGKLIKCRFRRIFALYHFASLTI